MTWWILSQLGTETGCRNIELLHFCCFALLVFALAASCLQAGQSIFALLDCKSDDAESFMSAIRMLLFFFIIGCTTGSSLFMLQLLLSSFFFGFIAGGG